MLLEKKMKEATLLVIVAASGYHAVQIIQNE